LASYRQDFLDACNTYADALRIRERPDVDNLGQRVLDDCEKLKLVRDQLVDWVLLESGANPSGEFEEALISELEQLLELKSRPSDVNSWNETWFEAHRVFVYQTFLYVVAALLRAGSFDTLRLLFTTHYQLPETEASRGNQFGTFDAFYGYSELLQILAPEGKKLLAPAATLIKPVLTDQYKSRPDLLANIAPEQNRTYSFITARQKEVTALMTKYKIK
jgi:hypothetical protein